eukprot:CAMPEP_0205849668 /NCGR_PEP_ID=MMETSP1019-20131125/30322_1 /ASSEMBLY_ACC=CAM_ASM_000403 /TAXON_ID=46462 /ORGANISM="Anophryoides haemophila, Strain AH6" /LENGTH=45 /DNA_ID= /DNA_START= /DNA_END= /DNA_ORIENTATION=
MAQAGVTAYLLHNGPASDVSGKAKGLSPGAEAKASLKMALSRWHA